MRGITNYIFYGSTDTDVTNLNDTVSHQKPVVLKEIGDMSYFLTSYDCSSHSDGEG